MFRLPKPSLSPQLRRGLLAAAFLAVGAAAAGIGWTYRSQLVATAAIRSLEAHGFGPVALTVASIGLASAHATNVSLYGGAVRADRLTLHFQPGELYTGHLQQIEIDGLRTGIIVDGDRVLVGGRPLPRTSGSSDIGLPVAFVTARDVEVEVTVPGLSWPMRVSGNGRLEYRTLTFELTGTMVADKGAALEVLAVGRHDLATATGAASLSMKTLRFHKRSTQPGDLLPTLANRLPPLDGEARASGSVSWKGGAIAPDIVLQLKGIGFETKQANVRDLAVDLHVVQLSPLATRPHQRLTATIEPGGMPPSQLALRFELQPKPILKVEGLTSEFAGGKVEASPFSVDPARPSIDTVMHLSNVEIDRVLRLLDIDGLAGNGKLGGDIGLHLRNGRLLIDDSRLVAAGPGELNISNAWLMQTLGEKNEILRGALVALSDFHYDTLTIELDRRDAGEGCITLHMQGRSPALASDQQFKFNVRLESNFDRLTELALQSIAAAHDLLRQP